MMKNLKRALATISCVTVSTLVLSSCSVIFVVNPAISPEDSLSTNLSNELVVGQSFNLKGQCLNQATVDVSYSLGAAKESQSVDCVGNSYQLKLDFDELSPEDLDSIIIKVSQSVKNKVFTRTATVEYAPNGKILHNTTLPSGNSILAAGTFVGDSYVFWGGGSSVGFDEGNLFSYVSPVGSLFDLIDGLFSPVSSSSAPGNGAIRMAHAIDQDRALFLGHSNSPFADTDTFSCQERTYFYRDNEERLGWIYNKSSNEWSAITPGPVGVSYESVLISASNSKIIWLEPSSVAQNHLYDAEADTWTNLNNASGLIYRNYPLALWTGREALVFGGTTSGFPPVVQANGARYNLELDSWTPMATANAPANSLQASAVWNGEEMYVFGGRDCKATALELLGHKYNPDTDLWSNFSTAGAPAARFDHVSVSFRSHMYVLGGKTDTSTFATGGGVYSYESDSWESLDPTAVLPGFQVRTTSLRSFDEEKGVLTLVGGFVSPAPLQANPLTADFVMIQLPAYE